MTWVEAELREQPLALERFFRAESERTVEIARTLVHEDVKYLLIASRGSSSNVARYAQYLFGTANRLPVSFATPSLYTVYDAPPELGPAAAIGISQSGESPDVVAVLSEARRQGRPTLAITNEPGSPLAQSADMILPLHAGEERAVAATKTYLSSIAAVALLSTRLATDDRRLSELLAMPAIAAEQIERSLAAAGKLDRYRDVDLGSVIARGVNYGTAFEIALKIRELSGKPFEAFSSADLMHGPIAALKPGHPAIVIAPSGRTLASLQAAVDRVRALGAEVVAISDDAAFLAAADVALPLAPTTPEWLSPLLAVIPGQVAAVRLATLRGANLDQPAGLTKITLTH